MNDAGTLPLVLTAASRALERLGNDLSTPRAALALLAQLGVALPSAPPSLLALTGEIDKVAAATRKLVEATDKHSEDSSEATAALAELSLALGRAFAALIARAGAIEAELQAFPDVLSHADIKQLLGRLLEHVLLAALAEEAPAVYGVLLLVGIIAEKLRWPDDGEDEVQLGHVERKLRWDRFEALTKNPSLMFGELYRWGAADFDHELLLMRAAYALRAFGLPADLATASLALGAQQDTLALSVPLLRIVTADAIAGLSFEFAAIGEAGESPPGLVAGLVGSGVTGASFELREGLELELDVNLAGGAPLALELRPGLDPKLRHGGAEASASVKLDWRRDDAARQKLITAGNWFRVDAGVIRAMVGAHADTNGKVEPRIEIGIVDGAFRLSGGKGDGFLQKILPEDGIYVDFDLTVGWSNKTGLYFKGGAGLEVTLPVNIDLFDVLRIDSIYLALLPKEDTENGSNIQATTAATVTAKLGPVSAVVEQFGLVVTLSFLEKGGNLGVANLDLGFKSPKGVGLAINAQAVTGSGYLSYDSDKKQYTGLLQLEIAEKISLSAVGLLTTRMSDGSKGYSLLILLSTRFEPGIQLGYGFVLKGLGGLFGVHRTVAVEVLRDGLRRGVLDAVLFPENIIEQAPQIISNLGTIFPPAHDRYLFGPMALIEWGGPSPLVTLELGIMLEVPEPVRLVMVGRLRIFLPRKDDSAPIRLQLDALGLIDFQSGNIALDAVLYDSVIGPYAVTGQMALRANFGAQPMFLLSVGGFHPAFPVPAGFPSLERVTFSLAKREGGVEVHLQMFAYLALTSNTVQFGAHLDLMARLGKFILTGQVGFDALIQLKPFGLTVSLEGAVAVKVSGTVLMGIRLQMNLTGPSPWHVWGKAKFKLLFVSITKEFDVQIGHEEPPALPPSIDVANELMAELTNSKNWSSHLPMGESQLVTFRTEPAAIQGSTTESLPEKVLIHPFAEIQVSQRRVPLDEPITQFNNMIPQGDTQFKLTVNLGEGGNNVPPSTQDVSDWFAPAQFAAMSDAEKLSAPSFKEMHSGIRFTAAKGYRCGKVSEATPITKTNTSNRGIDTGLSSELLARVAAFGAAGKASIRGTGPSKYRDPSRLGHGPTLRPPGYRVVAKQGGSVPTEVSLFLSYSAAQMQAIRTRIRNPYTPVAVVPDIGASK